MKKQCSHCAVDRRLWWMFSADPLSRKKATCIHNTFCLKDYCWVKSPAGNIFPIRYHLRYLYQIVLLPSNKYVNEEFDVHYFLLINMSTKNLTSKALKLFKYEFYTSRPLLYLLDPRLQDVGKYPCSVWSLWINNLKSPWSLIKLGSLPNFLDFLC